LADNSDAIRHLNDSTQVANLPSHITYGEIVYQKANFGLIATGQAPNINVTSIGIKRSYSVFGFFSGGDIPNVLFPSLSTTTKNFLTNNRSPDDPNLIGDGLIPAWMQYYTLLNGFPKKANRLDWVLNQTYLSVHTDAPSRVDDLLKQLRPMGLQWFPKPSP